MNINVKKSVAFALITFGAASLAHANSGSGTVTFSGSIVDAPCSIAPGSVDQTVDLGAVSNAALRNAGSSTPQNFQIRLEQCDTTTQRNVTTTFNGAAVPNSRLFAITGSASGAGVAINAAGSAPVIPGTATAAQAIGDGNNTLNFSAFLQGINASTTVVPGDFTAVTNFTLAYQ